MNRKLVVLAALVTVAGPLAACSGAGPANAGGTSGSESSNSSSGSGSGSDGHPGGTSSSSSSSSGSGSGSGSGAQPNGGAGTDISPSSSSGPGSGPDSGGGSSPDGGAIPCTGANIVGKWKLVGTGAVSITDTFNADGTFTLGIFVAAATPGDFDEEEVTGTYMVSNALLSDTPTAVSCATPAAPGINVCVLADGDLFMTDSNGTAVWTPDTAADPDPSTITLGCGTPFMPYPLTPQL